MITKLPLAGKLVASSRRCRERGIALLSVIGVLVLLAIVATPFLITQRDSAARGERFLYGARAEQEAESLFQLVRAHLTTRIEHVERTRLDSMGTETGSDTATLPPDDATPSSDIDSEIQLPDYLLDKLNRVSGREHRVWSVDVHDQQSLFNLNNCSVPILANLLGRTELVEDLKIDDETVAVEDASQFPQEGGVIRIGNEVIRYTAVEGSSFVGCERGYKADDLQNSNAGEWAQGRTVFSEDAVQIATLPYRIRPGEYVRYTNVYQARSIADLGVSALSPERFDRLRRYVTAWSGNAVGDHWSSPQMVKNAVTQSQQDISLNIKNARYFGAGTLVRLTDGVNYDYGVVVDADNARVQIFGKIEHDYQADQYWISTISRSPVNVNTASEDVLTLVFTGLKLRGRSAGATSGATDPTVGISEDRARNLAAFIKRWRPAVETELRAGSDRDPRISDWEDFTNLLNQAQNEDQIITQEEKQAVLLNAMNANDSNLLFSTVPFVFRSYDIYEVRATASIIGPSGNEIARRELRRMFEAATGSSSVFTVETQDDFVRQIMKSREGRWFASFPQNVDAHYDYRNIPASTYFPFAQKSRFPSKSRAQGEGDMRLLPAAFRYAYNRTEPDRVFHFDESERPDGWSTDQGVIALGVDGPYSVEQEKIDIVGEVEPPERNEPVEVGVKPFSCSFWYQPLWSRGGEDQVIFDYGAEEADVNRVALTYDGGNDRLELLVADATDEKRRCSVFYEFDHGTWEAEQWYHVGVSVHGCSPGLIELFIDGEKQGFASGVTRLTQGISATGEIEDLGVEDASTFPDVGVLLVRGRDGAELFEYTGRTEGSFTISRRKARSIIHANADTTNRSHEEGALVELYGFAGPLRTDVVMGGSATNTAFGPWRAFRVAYPSTSSNDWDVIENDVSGASAQMGGWAYASDYQPEITLTEWDRGGADGNIMDDLGDVNAEGLAVITATVRTVRDDDGVLTYIGGPGSQAGVGDQDAVVGGTDIVRYQVVSIGSEGVVVKLLDRGLDLRHVGSNTWVSGQDSGSGLPRFFPMYSYGADPDPSGMNVWRDPNDPNAPPGFYTAFMPIGLLAPAGTSPEYLDPFDEEPQTGGAAYVQVDGEWFRYDTFDDQTIANNVAFYRDQTLVQMLNQNFVNSGNALEVFQAQIEQSDRDPGGAGASGSGTVPEPAEELNDEENAPDEPASDNSDYEPPPHLSFEIAQDLDFRGYENRTNDEEFRIANTIPADHESNADIIPAFRMVAGNDLENTVARRGAYAGFNDLITLRDLNYNRETLRIQWGFDEWAAATTNVSTTWGWDKGEFTGDHQRFDSRAWTRALKFPSGELPDGELTTTSEFMYFGAGFEDPEDPSDAVFDEIYFPAQEEPTDRPDFAWLGSVPADVISPPAPGGGGTGGGTPSDPVFEGIDEKMEDIPVHFMFYDESKNAVEVEGIPIDEAVFPADGGVVQIEDEIILYSELDLDDGVFKDCIRGAFGTEPKLHDYGAHVRAVETFPSSVLITDVDESSGFIQLEDATDFPDDGYLRIADLGEVVGYTEREQNDLSMPLGRIDPTTAGVGSGNPMNEEITDSKQVGGGIFRARFGTTAASYVAGDVAIAMPFRHYDRYAERTDDPEMSHVQLSWTRHGAVWKRVTWDFLPITNVEIIAHLRFAGGPPWDSQDLIRVGERMPLKDRRRYIYEIADGKAENILNVESDRIEVRLYVRFAQGAYDRFAEVAPDAWKQTPWIQRVQVEYVQPPTVISQE